MPLFRKQAQNLTDEALMGRIQKGDTDAFNELYARYSKRLLYYFYRMLGGNDEKAQDFLQDLFFKIVDNPNLFHTRNRFSNWVFTVAHNMCKNEYRRQNVRKIVSYEPDMDLLPVSPEAHEHPIELYVDRQAFQKALFKELEKMSPNHRTTFILRHQENRSIKEISAILDCSEGTVKSRLFYSTQKLAQNLQSLNPYQNERCR